MTTTATAAAEAISAACPKELSQSPVARLAAMERRLEAMLQAVKTVRPAFDSFYASLTDEQKARLAEAGPRHNGAGVVGIGRGTNAVENLVDPILKYSLSRFLKACGP